MSIADNLWEQYRCTKFWVNDPSRRFYIVVGEHSPELDRLLTSHRAKEWAYITAHNPGSRRMSAKDNDLRNQRLLTRIERQGYSYLKGEGVGGDSDWPPEESYLIIGLSRSDAIRLGSEFGQNAIVAGLKSDTPELVACNNIRTG